MQHTKKKGHSHDCSLKTIRKEQLEDFVVQHTISDVLQDDVIDYIADKVIEINKKHTVNQLLSQLKSALRKAENGRNNLLKAIEDGIYTPSTKERLLELENECEELKVQIAKESIKKPEITKDHVVYWLEMFRKGNIKDEDSNRGSWMYSCTLFMSTMKKWLLPITTQTITTIIPLMYPESWRVRIHL